MSLLRRLRTLWLLSSMEVGLTDYKTGRALDKGPLLDVSKRFKNKQASIVDTSNPLDNVDIS